MAKLSKLVLHLYCIFNNFAMRTKFLHCIFANNEKLLSSVLVNWHKIFFSIFAIFIILAIVQSSYWRAYFRTLIFQRTSLTPPPCRPSKTTLAGRSAKMPLVTTPTMLFNCCSNFPGSKISKFHTSKMTLPLSVTKPLR